MLLCASCSGDAHVKVNANQQVEILKDKQEEIDNGNFVHGTWKIDSVGENNSVIDRLTKDSIIQVFNFRKDGIFSAMEVTPRMTKDQVIGKWKVEADSVFIISEKGNIAMRYGYEFNGPRLTLNGNFQISANNKKKPSFYLSKYNPNTSK
jgi:hypothetical protein